MERRKIMIYFTGDTHGETDIEKLSFSNWQESRNLTKKDYLVILGDFGFPFLDKDVTADNQPAPHCAYSFWIKWLADKPYTILWVDGNHENFNYWDRQKITEWHGGKVQVHPHADNIIRLMRGECYEIDGKTFFTFGGARSADKAYRIPNLTWWKQEEATEEEISHARETLTKHNYNVDFILTHTMPDKVSGQVFGMSSTDRTALFLNEVMSCVDYDLWFCGHYHRNLFLQSRNLFVLYKKIYSLDECFKIKNGETV